MYVVEVVVVEVVVKHLPLPFLLHRPLKNLNVQSVQCLVKLLPRHPLPLPLQAFEA